SRTCGERVGVSDHDLDCSPSIAQIDENHPSVVAPASDPAVELDLAPFVGRAKRAAVGRVESAHARRVGSSTQSSSTWSPLDMSRNCATLRFASSGVSSTTHLAPSLFAERIFAFRLFGA